MCLENVWVYCAHRKWQRFNRTVMNDKNFPSINRWRIVLGCFRCFNQICFLFLSRYDLPCICDRTLHFARYLLHFDMFTCHLAWYLLQFSMSAFHFARYLLHVGTSNVHVGFFGLLEGSFRDSFRVTFRFHLRLL